MYDVPLELHVLRPNGGDTAGARPAMLGKVADYSPIDLVARGQPPTLLVHATHFFGFHHRPGQEQTRGALADALTRWGWMKQK